MKLLIVIVLSFWLFSYCTDECRSYSDFSCSQIEEAEYNVYFYYPNQTEAYLGKVEGLKACGNTAYNYAFDKDMTRNIEWGYVCCMIAKGSSCYEKHR